MKERIKKIIVVVIILILAIILIPKFNSKVEGTRYHKHTDECYQTIYHTHNESCYETHAETIECGAKYLESNVQVMYYSDEDYYEISIFLICEQRHGIEIDKHQYASPDEIDQIRADYEAHAQTIKELDNCHILTTQTVQTLICGKEEGEIESQNLICGEQEMWGYVVEYLLEDEYGNYNTYRSVEKIVYANTVTENAISIDGYIPKTESQSVELSYNDDTIIRFYYERTKYPMTIEPQNKIKSLRVEGQSQQIVDTNPVNTITGNFKQGEKINIITEIKDGYEFLGWQDQVSGEMVTNIFAMKMAPAHLVPITDIITYNIQLYHNDDNNTIEQIQYNVESEEFALPIPGEKSGYIFEGWIQNEGDTPVQNLTIPIGSVGNRTYYAKWSKGQYTVTFRDGTATAKTQTVNYGESATAPSLTRAGYTLSWDKDFSNVTSNIIVNAIWTANANTAYKIEHYKQTDAGYILSQTENLSRNNRYNSNSESESIRRIYRKYNI